MRKECVDTLPQWNPTYSNHSGFKIEGPSQAKIDVVKDPETGAMEVTYWPTAPGEYAVHVLLSNDDTPKSPYMADIKAAEPGFDAGKVVQTLACQHCSCMRNINDDKNADMRICYMYECIIFTYIKCYKNLWNHCLELSSDFILCWWQKLYRKSSYQYQNLFSKPINS